MQSVEVLLRDRVLAQVRPVLQIRWVKLSVFVIGLMDVLLVYLIDRKGAAAFVVDHEVEDGHLVGQRVAQANLYPC